MASPAMGGVARVEAGCCKVVEACAVCVDEIPTVLAEGAQHACPVALFP